MGAFAFASGVTLTSPIPNPLILKNVLVGDWSLGAAAWGLDANGTVTAPDVPSGSAYIASQSLAPSGPIELTFPRDVIRVGIYSTSFPGSVSLSAYAAGGALLETVSIPAVAAAG